jgi:hypothetical protein
LNVQVRSSFGLSGAEHGSVPASALVVTLHVAAASPEPPPTPPASLDPPVCAGDPLLPPGFVPPPLDVLPAVLPEPLPEEAPLDSDPEPDDPGPPELDAPFASGVPLPEGVVGAVEHPTTRAPSTTNSSEEDVARLTRG